VRWDELFDDIEAQFDAADAADLAAEVADRSRREVASLRLVDRLNAVVGSPVALRVLGAGAVEGTLTAIGPDWLLLAESGGRESLVAAAAVVAVGGLAAQSDAPHSQGTVAARLGLTYALRVIVRDRAAVSLTLIDGSTSSGTLDRVGADFVEVAEHPQGEPRRRTAVRAVRAYPLAAVAVVRRA
jgi:hypothetical protein